MPNDTSVPCSFENRDRLRCLKESGETWDEFLDRATLSLSENEEFPTLEGDDE